MPCHGVWRILRAQQWRVSTGFVARNRHHQQHHDQKHTKAMEGLTIKFIAERDRVATGDIRRAKLDWPVSFDTVCMLAKRLFDVPQVKFRYIDEEGDRVVLSSQYEFDCACIMNRFGTPLRFYTELPNNEDHSEPATRCSANDESRERQQKHTQRSHTEATAEEGSVCSCVVENKDRSACFEQGSRQVTVDEVAYEVPHDKEDAGSDIEDTDEEFSKAVETVRKNIVNFGRFLSLVGEGLTNGTLDLVRIIEEHKKDSEGKALPPRRAARGEDDGSGFHVPAALQTTDMERHWLKQLYEIGFTNTPLNLILLRSHAHDMDATVKCLLDRQD